MLRRLKKEVEKSLPPKEETILFTGKPSIPGLQPRVWFVPTTTNGAFGGRLDVQQASPVLQRLRILSNDIAASLVRGGGLLYIVGCCREHTTTVFAKARQSVAHRRCHTA